MNTAERRRHLQEICAADRAAFVEVWKRSDFAESPQPTSLPRRILDSPWVDAAVTTLTPFIPPKFRLAGLALRLWQKRRDRTRENAPPHVQRGSSHTDRANSRGS
jgi:hypothetical protein